MSKADLVDAVEANRERLVELAEDIWATPEVALQESESSARLQSVLRDEGFEVETRVGGIETAFVASYGDGGPVVGTMGEFDALPGMSQRVQAEREPVEEGAPGHGCGHNLFGVGSLGGALAVKEAIDRGEVDGTVVYFGTPAEEAGGGKVYMVRDGAFTGDTESDFDGVDAVVSWHPGWYNAPGRESCLAVDSYEFAFSGESSHAAASPEAGRSALDAVQLLNTGVEYMREHVPDAARVHYVVTEGGDAPNVVPATASVEYLIRAPERTQVERIAEWVRDVAEGAALMTQTDVEVAQTSGMYGVLPNGTLADAIYENMADLGRMEFTAEQAELAAELRDSLGDVSAALGRIPEDYREAAADAATYTEPMDPSDEGAVGSYSTDSGDVSWNVPLGRFTAATWPVGTPAHSWQAVAASGSVGTEGALYASKVIASTLYDLLADDGLREAAREEFEAATADRPYESPLPAAADPYELVDR